MKGSLRKMQGRSVESIIRAKNREIRNERERAQALEITNTIISAYLSLLVEKVGSVKISKKAVSEALGNFMTSARSEGDDYIITVEKAAGSSSVAGAEKAAGSSSATIAGKGEEDSAEGEGEPEGDDGE